MRRRGWRAGRLRADDERPQEAMHGKREGEPLPASLKARAERSLGVPLSTVRMHRGAGATALAEAHGARALTVGDQIYAGPRANSHSVAHELVHVAQNRRAPPARDGRSTSADASESEARALAPAVLAGVASGGVRQAPAATLQRDDFKPDSSAPVRERLRSYHVAGFGKPPPDWEKQFAPQVLAPDPTISELKQKYRDRRALNATLPDRTGIDLAQDWANDLTAFRRGEMQRFGIDGLIESLIAELPTEIWLPNRNVIHQQETEKDSLTITNSNGPYSPEPLRNKLYTRLLYIRGTTIDRNNPTGLIWDDTLSFSGELGDTGNPFQLDEGDYTQREQQTLYFFFQQEMREWARRQLKVEENVETEKQRRHGLIAAGTASAAEKFVYVAIGGSALVGSGAALIAGPGMTAYGAGSTWLSNFTLQAATQVAPRVTGWALTHPYASTALLMGGLGIGHDIASGDFHPLNLPFYFMGMYGGYRADKANLGGGGMPLPTPGRTAPAPATAPSTGRTAPPVKPPAPTPTPTATPGGSGIANVTDHPIDPNAPLPKQPMGWMPSKVRDTLLALRLAIANAVPATSGTGGGGGTVGGRPVPALTTRGGGTNSLQPPLVDPDTAPLPGGPRIVAPAPAPNARSGPGVVQSPPPAQPTPAPVVTAPVPAPVATPAAPPTVAPQIAPTSQTPAPAPSQQAPAVAGPQTSAESQMGVSRDQRAWQQELFAGNFTTGLRDVLGRLWQNAARAGDRARLRYWNARYLFNLHRVRFWRAVRGDRDAMALLTAAGARFIGAPGSAPWIVLPNGIWLQLTIDHIVERQQDPTRALDADNLRLSTRRESTVVLRLLNQLDPFINIFPGWVRFRLDDLDGDDDDDDE